MAPTCTFRYTRALIAQKEGSGSLVSKSVAVLKGLPSLRWAAATLEAKISKATDGTAVSDGLDPTGDDDGGVTAAPGLMLGASLSAPVLAPPASPAAFDVRASYAQRNRPARTLRGVAHAASASSLVIDAVQARRPRSAAPGYTVKELWALPASYGGAPPKSKKAGAKALTPFKSATHGTPTPKNNLMAAAARGFPPSSSSAACGGGRFQLRSSSSASLMPSGASRSSPHAAATPAKLTTPATPDTPATPASMASMASAAMRTPLPPNLAGLTHVATEAPGRASRPATPGTARTIPSGRAGGVGGYDALRPMVGNEYHAMPKRTSAEAATERRRAAQMAAIAARSNFEVNHDIASAILGSGHVAASMPDALNYAAVRDRPPSSAAMTPAMSAPSLSPPPTDRRPPVMHTVGLPKDRSRLPPKRGLPDAEELRQLAGEFKGGALGSRGRLARLREVFNSIDTDESGTISARSRPDLARGFPPMRHVPPSSPNSPCPPYAPRARLHLDRGDGGALPPR